jgi:hypothetical protein
MGKPVLMHKKQLSRLFAAAQLENSVMRVSNASKMSSSYSSLPKLSTWVRQGSVVYLGVGPLSGQLLNQPAPHRHPTAFLEEREGGSGQ